LPLQSETQHLTVGGATGAGKTLLIIQILDQVQDRASTDAAIIWDPTGVLMRRYYNTKRGDIVLNPLDTRCPSWNPAWELKGMSQEMAAAAAQAMGTSLYVGRTAAAESERFFTDAAIALWKHIVVNSTPTEAQELAYWMANATPELDLRVRGTKLEQDLDPGSTPQRNGIISTFTKVEHALSAIPLSTDAPKWTVKDWCANRKGWLFLTTTAETKESLRPIQSLWLDMLIRQLMAQGERPDLRAPWFFFDELAALQRLPTLESGLSEGRKFNLRFVLGFQAMSQVEALYGKEGAQTLLAMPKTQVLLRTGEAMAADWMSKQCGDQRIEELKESYPAAWSGGNGNRTVSTEIKDRRLFIPSEFMGLKDLRGILRHGNSLVRIEIPYMARVQQAPAFLPRPGKPMPEVKAEPKLDPPQTCEPDSMEIAEAVPAGGGLSESESQIEY
jgi:type IV secretory pathway TraG/TraD family ATPase VirD4